MKKKFCILLSILIFVFTISVTGVFASSYLADKTEIPVDLEIPGAEALCQTDDGFVWIGQYSGLTRYDSKEKVTFKNIVENDISYDIINVRSLATSNNVLYVMTYKNLFKYENNQFSTILRSKDDLKSLIDEEISNLELYELELDASNNKLYISSNIGLIIYNISNNSFSISENTKNIYISDCAVDKSNGNYYYVRSDGVYDKDGRIYEDVGVLDIYVYKDILVIGTINSAIRYNLTTGSLDDKQYDMVTDQVNKILYSERNNMIYLALENNGLYCIDDKTFNYSIADNLENSKQLIDVMVDYENNIWVASHNVASTGVSIITKNALVNLLHEDNVWSSVPNKQVNAVEKINDKLYICSKSGLFIFDTETEKISSSNTIMTKLDEYLISIGIDQSKLANQHDFRDVEKFKNDIYFAVYGVGVLKYNTETNDVKIYGDAFIQNDENILKINGSNLEAIASLKNVRILRAFDNFLAIGYQAGGVIKLENDKYTVYNSGKNVVYINASSDGKVLVDQTNEIYTLSDDFETKTTIPTETTVVGNRLKFLVDGNKIFYTLNSRLFCCEKVDNEYKNYEVVVPRVKGSIVELAKIKVKTGDVESYKYVLATQSQVYIIDYLVGNDSDNHKQIGDYEIYDSTNGLKPIAANTSGFYDEVEEKYYFQTTEGVFTYNFNISADEISPLKIAIKNIDVDGEKFYGNDLTVEKNTNRLVFDLAVLGFRPNKGYTVYYKLDGVDDDYLQLSEGQNNVSYTNLSGGNYKFHVYVMDEFNQKSNELSVSIYKPLHVYEQPFFWIFIISVAVAAVCAINFGLIYSREKKSEQREKELKGVTIESIEAIARTIDAKDTYTNGHSIRVGHYSRIIAEALGMQGDELENLYYIALLHDIGKIGIPDAILNKPGRLTDEEFAIMKSHTTKGAKILKDISTIPNIVEGAKYHHEKYGGGGYPEGLKGEEIPYIARIICCADCFDAMATKRVYKDPYPKEKIISEFERCKEIQFDPNIADVVIKLIEEGKLKAELEEDLNERLNKVEEIKKANN